MGPTATRRRIARSTTRPSRPARRARWWRPSCSTSCCSASCWSSRASRARPVPSSSPWAVGDDRGRRAGAPRRGLRDDRSLPAARGGGRGRGHRRHQLHARPRRRLARPAHARAAGRGPLRRADRGGRRRAPAPRRPADRLRGRAARRGEGRLKAAVDIFERAAADPTVALLNEARGRSLVPYFRPAGSAVAPKVELEGAPPVVSASANYLGLADPPAVIAGARSALERYGGSTTGSRLLNGTLELHEELEAEIADWMQAEDALAFTTGYQ